MGSFGDGRDFFPASQLSASGVSATKSASIYGSDRSTTSGSTVTPHYAFTYGETSSDSTIPDKAGSLVAGYGDEFDYNDPVTGASVTIGRTGGYGITLFSNTGDLCKECFEQPEGCDDPRCIEFAPVPLDIGATGRTFSDEGGDLVTLFAPTDSWPGFWFKDAVYKVRIEHASSGTLFPTVGYCYGAVQGSGDAISLDAAGQRLTFAIPPCYVGVYNVHIVWTILDPKIALVIKELGIEGNVKAPVVKTAFVVDRRNKDRPTYRGRARLPLRYMTGPVDVRSEANYPGDS